MKNEEWKMENVFHSFRGFLRHVGCRLSCGALSALLVLLFSFLAWPVWGKIAPPKNPIAVVQATSACAVADRGYAASRAKWTQRSLAEGGVTADLVGDGALARELAGRKLIYLVTCQTPSATQLAALNAFRTRGGKIAVLQSYSPSLAALMKVACTRTASPRTWPVSVVPAVGGWWSANFFTSDDEEETKIRRLLAFVDVGVPGRRAVATWEAKQKARRAAERAKAQVQKPRAGEIHAVWDHSGEGLYPGDWPRTIRLLKANGVTDLFVNVAGAGFAHYASRVLPVSSVCQTRGDQLAACLAAARGSGIRVHAWILCFNTTRATSARLALLARKGWRLKDTSGRLTPYLDPSHADVRWHLLTVLDELAAKEGLAGVHLDFVRWYEKAAKPPQAARFVEQFLAAARTRLRKKQPRLWLTAAVLPRYPSCVTVVGQDWEAWLVKGLVDYIVPMNYVEDTNALSALLARQARTPRQARHVISGIGVTANESRLTPSQVIDQVNAARRAGVAGVALFDLDQTLAQRILPLLRLGLFR